MTKSRSSADVWYSGYSPCGVRVRRPERQVEAGGAVLPLVVAVGREVDDAMIGAGAEHVLTARSFGVAAAAALVGERRTVTDTR